MFFYDDFMLGWREEQLGNSRDLIITKCNKDHGRCYTATFVNYSLYKEVVFAQIKVLMTRVCKTMN